jgi:hypothetical protein
MHTANGSWTKTDGSFYITTAGHSWRLRGAEGEGGDPVYAARRRDGQQCDGSTSSVLGTCRLYQWVEHGIGRWSTGVEVAGAVEAGTENKRVAMSGPQALAKVRVGKWADHFREKIEITLEAPVGGPHG